ncbi:MAG: GNAT family N-acetyltransferase [Candidatus Omnitrophota bacterium]|jgi:RimJ/RimL family protein N-acetyltransferase
MIKGDIVTLQPAAQHDKRTIYQWLIQWKSLASNYSLPSWDEFCDDYKPFFFDGSRLKTGRCFIITVDNVPVGQINYHTLYEHFHHTELDIWMKGSENCGKGYGSDALKALCDYLFTSLGIKEFVIRPSAKNLQAIKAYGKAGFHQVKCNIEEQTARYGAPDSRDCVVLVKQFKG